jgi:hypothetical protein
MPEFSFGISALKAELGGLMGEPLECEHANPDERGLSPSARGDA